MKKIILFVVMALIMSATFVSNVEAGYVNGYYRSNGTYVSGYYRSSPNALKYDNYGYTGGSRYNSSYYSPRTYTSSWYTPSYQTDTNYYYGLSRYRSSRY